MVATETRSVGKKNVCLWVLSPFVFSFYGIEIKYGLYGTTLS